MSQEPESDASRELRQRFQLSKDRYRPGLERALRYFLESETEAALVTGGALEQAERQWVALEGEANPLHLIGLAAADQCELLLPRPEGDAPRRVPTALQLIRHLEWFDWEQRIEALKLAIAVREASVREAERRPEDDAEVAELQEKLDSLISLLFRAQLGLSDEDENAGGGIPATVTPEPPGRGPGEKRTVDEALALARNP